MTGKHPYPKPILPIFPTKPLLPAPTSYAGYFTTAPDVDGRTAQWGFDEFLQEAQHCVSQQFPGTHEARSTQYYIGLLQATTGGQFQVFDNPNLTTDQQKSSVELACRYAREMGRGTTGWTSCLHADLAGAPPTPILGGAFANNNYKDGVIVFHGVTADEVLKIMQDGLTGFIRAGGIIE